MNGKIRQKQFMSMQMQTDSVKKITVKDWLRRNGDGEIIDFSNLQDIKNTEGDEEYTQNADGTITWENKGEDISYEGTSNQQLPVTTKVTYYLDGKEIKPEDLAGKSGKVKIRFDYTNNESRTVNIDSKDVGVKVPFLAASMLMLPGDKFKNVKGFRWKSHGRPGSEHCDRNRISRTCRQFGVERLRGNKRY